MKRSKPRKTNEVSAEEAIEFIYAMQALSVEQDGPTQMISLRVPQNVLRALKIKAKSQGKKYQSFLLELVKKGLAEEKG